MAENHESEVFGPNPAVAATSHVGSMEEYQRLYRLSIDDPETFHASFTVADGYVVECFASELDFAEVANPLALTFDETTDEGDEILFRFNV